MRVETTHGSYKPPPVRPCLGSPGIINLVGSHILRLGPLSELSRSLQLPVVKAEQEHLGEFKHCLPLSGGQVAKFVLHKVQDTLRRREGGQKVGGGWYEQPAEVSQIQGKASPHPRKP